VHYLLIDLDDLIVYIYLGFMTMYYCNVTWSDMFGDEPEGASKNTDSEMWECSISDMALVSYILLP